MTAFLFFCDKRMPSDVTMGTVLSVAEVGDFFDSGVVQPLRLTWIGSENIYKKKSGKY